MICLAKLFFNIIKIKKKVNEISFTLYPAHSRLGREKPSVKTFRSLLTAELRWHCVLSCGTQSRALPRHHS